MLDLDFILITPNEREGLYLLRVDAGFLMAGWLGSSSHIRLVGNALGLVSITLNDCLVLAVQLFQHGAVRLQHIVVDRLTAQGMRLHGLWQNFHHRHVSVKAFMRPWFLSVLLQFLPSSQSCLFSC